VKKCLTILALMAMIVPGIASAKPGDPPLKRERHKYLVLYFSVRHKDGKRAPGRQILRQGVRHHGKVRPATAKEVAASIRQLRLLLHPAMSARPPAQAPGGVLTARAVGGVAACIRQHESGGNYRAVDPSGKYRGAYQFDYATFAAAGGHGDPAAASPAEQDAAFERWWPGHHSAWPLTSHMCGY
jgi:hypothetical protein